MSEFNFVQKLIIYAVPVLFAITVHEVAHGWIASKLGDQTAKMMGRLTLNPVKHIDPIGTILVPIMMLMVSPFILGWAKPVPVDWRNLKRPKQDMALVAIAGPGANLLMMVFWALLAKLIIVSGLGNYHYSVPIITMAMVGIGINIVLMVLNLIPIPPLDGSRVLSAALPPKASYQYNRLEPYGLIIV
ncbi:MAG: site-2 protease family protein, partial [Gammaproteobacteria bacterium]|nr:site-2 protease family protein [Gammaproteobacteria bacterium]